MPDLTDDVQELVIVFNETSLKTQLENNKPKKPYVDGEVEVECEECGVVIPDKRRRHGHALCVDCQTYVEKLDKLRKMRNE